MGPGQKRKSFRSLHYCAQQPASQFILSGSDFPRLTIVLCVVGNVHLANRVPLNHPVSIGSVGRVVPGTHDKPEIESAWYSGENRHIM